MKDYYDIYLIYKFKFNKINKTKFRIAIDKTYEKREFNEDLIVNLNVLKDSEILRDNGQAILDKMLNSINIFPLQRRLFHPLQRL